MGRRVNLDATSPFDQARVIEIPPETEDEKPVETAAVEVAAETVDDRAPPPVPVVADATKLPPKYRVVGAEKKQISWGRHMAAFAPGDVVSDLSHGVGAIRKMKAAGIELEEIPPPK